MEGFVVIRSERMDNSHAVFIRGRPQYLRFRVAGPYSLDATAGATEMKISRTPVTWFLERLFCDCGGEMKSTGMVLTSNPYQYPHKCSNCDFGATLHESYPRVMYEEVK